MKKSLSLLGILFITVHYLLFVSFENVETNEVASGDLLLANGVRLWTENNYVVSVCWSTDGCTLQKQWVEDAIRDSWESNTSLTFQFYDFGATNTPSNCVEIKVIEWVDRVAKTFRESTSSNVNCDLNGATTESLGIGASILWEFDPNGTPNRNAIENVGVHEFGHVLGFDHEHLRIDNEGGKYCEYGKDCTCNTKSSALPIGPYDYDSIMEQGYCSTGNGLTEIDISSARSIYGWPGQIIDIGICDRLSEFWAINSSENVVQWTGGEWVLRRSGDHKAIDVGPQDEVWVIESDNDIYRYNSGSWEEVAGQGTDIGVGADGDVWMVGKNGGVFQRTTGRWTDRKRGEHLAIDVDHLGFAWVINEHHKVFKWNGRDWVSIPGIEAIDISLSSNGKVWVIERESRLPHYYLPNQSRWIPNASELDRVTRFRYDKISVGPYEHLALVKEDNRFYLRNRYQWPGEEFVDITLSDRNGSPWAIKKNREGEKRVYSWNGVYWKFEKPGNHIAIDAGKNNEIWVIDKNNRLYRKTPPRWEEIEGIAAKDIGIDPSGEFIWIVGKDGNIYQRIGDGWERKLRGNYMAIDVGSHGNVWIVSKSNKLAFWDGRYWNTPNGRAIDVTIDENGTPWIVGPGGRIYYRESGTWKRWTPSGMPREAKRISGGIDGRVAVVKNDGSLSLTQKLLRTNTREKSTTYSLSRNWRKTWQIYPGDYNGDNRLDLFLYDKSGSKADAYIMRFMKFQKQKQFKLAENSWRKTWQIYPGDYNGDGVSDLFCYDASGIEDRKGVAFLISFNRRGEVEEEQYLYRNWRLTWEVFPADYDGNGTTDLVLFDRTGAKGLGYLVRFDQSGRQEFIKLSGENGWRKTWQIHTGDFNGDSRADLLLYDPSGTVDRRGAVRLINFNNEGQIENDEIISRNWRKTWQIYPGDYDGNNITDLVLYDNSKTKGDVYYIKFLPNGRRSQKMLSEGKWRTTWNLYPADYDGNGTMELFLFDPSQCPGYGILMAINSRDELETKFKDSTMRTHWEIYPGDYNGSGKNDIFIYDPSGKTYPRGVAEILTFEW